MVSRSVRRREIVAWLPERYQEKVFVEEENLQDYQKRREEEKVRNWKLHRENLLRKLQMWLERSPVDVSGMVLFKMGKEGKAMQRPGLED